MSARSSTPDLPIPPDCRRDRAKLDRLRGKLAEIRWRYQRFIWPRVKKMTPRQKNEVIGILAQKMQERGLYSRTTFPRDVRLGVLCKFCTIDGGKGRSIFVWCNKWGFDWPGCLENRKYEKRKRA